MERSRIIHTRIWNDPFVEDMPAQYKLLFIYLLTNSHTNLLGVYEISISRITFETGLTREDVVAGLEYLGEKRRAYYTHNYIILPNFLKNQRLNRNMQMSVITAFDNLPSEVRSIILGDNTTSLPNGSRQFPRIKERLENYRVEGDPEPPAPKKGRFVPPTKQEVIDYFVENGYREDVATEAWMYYQEGDWHDKNGDKVKNWKQKMRGVWFKSETKDKSKKYKDLSKPRESGMDLASKAKKI